MFYEKAQENEGANSALSKINHRNLYVLRALLHRIGTKGALSQRFRIGTNLSHFKIVDTLLQLKNISMKLLLCSRNDVNGRLLQTAKRREQEGQFAQGLRVVRVKGAHN